MNRLRLLLSHPPLQGVVLAICLGLWLTAQGPAAVWLLALLGIPLQMLNEYNLHRFIFHLPPPKRQWAFNLLYRAHYGHHDFPTNRELFFVPGFIVFPVMALNFLWVWTLLAVLNLPWAVPGAAALVLVGGSLTFLAYEWFHATAHLPVPKTAVERHVTTLHNQHHFRDFSKWFHVTAGGAVIDRAMGTAIDRDALKGQQRMEFIRTLGLQPDDPRLVAARTRYAGKYGLTEEEITRAAKT
ncbi:sterol desaturase family protein [Paracoccaceae bacterium GXU_MW_L88]